jgi:hypothetical protein
MNDARGFMRESLQSPLCGPSWPHRKARNGDLDTRTESKLEVSESEVSV